MKPLKYIKSWLPFLLAVWPALYGCQSAGTKELRVMSYNVRNGRGMDDSVDYSRAAKVINDFAADLVAVQELDSASGRSGGAVVLDTLAALTGMHASYARAIDFDGGGYGIGILSKGRPLRTQKIPLPGREEERVLLVAEFEDYIVLATHLSLTEEDRMMSARLIVSACREFAKPAILAGDLNDEPSSEMIRFLSEELTLVSDTTQATYPADRPRGCIDYIFIRNTTNNKFISSASGVTDAPVESDHRPVYSVLEY